MRRTLFLSDENATVEFGRRIGERMTSGVIYLQGTLGAGKTTFTRGVLLAFGYSGAVKSPTYTLVEPYVFGDKTIHHFDLYRLGDPEELEYMGIRDYFSDTHLCLVEWPNRGQGFLPEADLVIDLTVDGTGRKAELRANNKKGEHVIDEFE